METFFIRTAEEKDAKEIHDIYSYYVENTAITFSTENQSVEEYKKQIAETKKAYPYFVAQGSNGRILGFIYGHQLRPHEAYKWNVESTVYLAPDAPKRRGIGTALYKKFLETLSLQGFKYDYGVITSENTASIEMHKKLGFREIGNFQNAGNKDGKWHGIFWMQIQVGEISENPAAPVPFSKLKIQQECKIKTAKIARLLS